MLLTIHYNSDYCWNAELSNTYFNNNISLTAALVQLPGVMLHPLLSLDSGYIADCN